MVHIRVLGSFAAERNGEPLPLGGHRQRSVLALLVSARGRVVSADRMIEELWQGAAPARAVASLQAYVSNLRRLLEPGRAPRAAARLLVSSPPGYALRLPEDAVDAWRFERLLGDARGLLDREPDRARGLLREALALWRGPAYAETADEPWSHAEITRLDELRLAARELYLAAGLRTADIAEVVSEAALLTRDEPLREEGWRLHALALWASGRQADALSALRRARAVLAEEVGLDPGAALVGLERAILAQDDRVLRRATAGPGVPEPPVPVPVPVTAAAVPAPQQPQVGPVAGEPGADDALFVGREAELALLEGAADRVRTAGPGIALVSGEAGLGKSALLHRFCDRLRTAGWLVAVGRNADAEGAPPAWAWAEALRAVAATAPPGPAADAVAPLLCDGPPRAAAGAGEDTAAGRFRMHRAVGQWLAAAARQQPVCVVLDDLHWADGETLALLGATAELPPSAPLLLVGAFRPDEVPPRLADALAVLARHSPTRVALGGLPEVAVAEVVRALAGPEPDAGTVAALAERTGGNPFYVRESARLLRSEGALVALSEVPEGVRDVLRRRLGRLPEAVVSVLRLAAVAGREPGVEVLVDAADAGEDAVLDALEAGLLAGLLVEPAPGRVRFAHALVRDTLLADLSRLRAARMHGRIGGSLERLGPDDVSGLAHHFVRAASSATAAKAVEYCVRAAALADRRFAHDTAAALLAEAVACFERVPAGAGAVGDREAEHVELLGRLVRARVRAGAVMAAREARGAAIDRAVAAGRESLLIRAFTAWTEPSPWQTRPYGTVDQPVVALLERLLERPGPEPSVRCRLLGAYAAELSDARIPKVLAAAREALALAEDLGDPPLRAAALVTLIRELDPDLEWRERDALGRRLERLAAAHELPAHRWSGLFTRATARAAAGDVPGTHRFLGEAAEVARSYRMPEASAVSDCVAATLAHVEGRMAQAELLYARAAAEMARQGSPHAQGYLAVAVATLRASEGRLAQTLPGARRAYTEYGPDVGDLLAVALAAAGEHDEARSVLERCGPLRPDYLFRVFGTFRAMTLVALGEQRGAAELYADLLPYRDAPPPAAGLSLATRPVAATLAELAALLGRSSDAAAHAAVAARIRAQWRGR
ncbi:MULTISPECIES: BTAD domain-containing putative transcriptional regulator [unclassified Streptomyces]|uniref:BTAD domain-containing putative transcriptional regulator n=1 Tax=unclassified Streptomyces TaxID=2593676 RepID=UPI0022516EC1|nr:MULTISPECIES: BTAD domain-containing putative transcriptional regulator [unclassified Streptomyces]MCX4528554.1 AAA family ATPase [Streptomyces sp. NBC_01551]MCX4540848.1 AAA family ATPase [Streptomyces sp. NBC_01565]